MNIVVISIGTHGDVRPIAALARRLHADGHRLTVLTGERHRSFLEAEGCGFDHLPPDFTELMISHRVALEKGRQLAVARAVSRALTRCAAEWVDTGRTATRSADLIIGAGMGTTLGASLAEQQRIPFVQAQFMPLTPSRHVPGLWLRAGSPLPPIVNLASWHLTRLLTWQVMEAPTRVIRSKLGLPHYSRLGPWYDRRERRRRRLILYAFSRYLQLPPPDWSPDQISVTGFWSLGPPPGWAPPARLEAFLAAGPKPAYVGFGSIATGSAAALTRIVVEAVRRAGHRLVVATGSGALAPESIEPGDDVLAVADVPHDWLFPRVLLAVHHGGAGTTAAASSAGIPQVVVPFNADQFFWAGRLHRLGVNPVRLSRSRLTVDGLHDALMVAVGARCREAARRLAVSMADENGIENAVARLGDWGLLADPAAAIPCGKADAA